MTTCDRSTPDQGRTPGDAEPESEESLEEIQDRLIDEIEEEPEWLRREIEEENERWFTPRGFFGLFKFRTSVP